MSRRVSRVDELAQAVPPSRDLWPAISREIAASIEADRMGAAPEGGRTGRRAAWMPALGLAASVALVAVGVFIGRSIGPQAGQTMAQGQVNPANPPPDRAVIHDVKYLKQRDALLAEVQAKLKTMPPAERDKVAASLATLRRSITEIETQLGHDPANALLQELLVNSCQEEMRALTAVRDSGREEI